MDYGKKLTGMVDELSSLVRDSKNGQGKSRSRSPVRSLSPGSKNTKKSAGIHRHMPQGTVLTKSPERKSKREHSRETKHFIERLDGIKANLEVEGMALAGHYKRIEDEKNKQIKMSDKETNS